MGDGGYVLKNAEVVAAQPVENYEICMEYSTDFNEQAKAKPVIENEDGTVSVLVSECYTEL